MDQGLITVTSSGWEASLKDVLSREGTKYCYSSNYEGSWFKTDFGEKIRIKPTSYTWRKDKHPNHNPRHWNFEGSNDDNNWTVIKKHDNDTSLTVQYQSHTWNIANCNQSYRMFRIISCGVNSTGNYNVMCHGFEIYGHLRGNK